MNVWLANHFSAYCLLIMLFGGVGAVCRWGLDSLIRRIFTKASGIGIVCVNTIAVFIMAFSVVCLGNLPLLPLLTTGFLGGFSTFSTHVFQVFTQIKEDKPWSGIALLLGGWLAGIGATIAGVYLAFYVASIV